MIKVTKDFDDIPDILTLTPRQGISREGVFNHNIQNNKYCDTKNSYKAISIQKKLNSIYNLKCAYCEQKLLDAPKHLEHYRPKNYYYWLAYSWDNLLLSCGSCNSSKGDNFKILGKKVSYANEAFNEVHKLGQKYDKVEIPQIINPEKEDILNDIRYDKNGYISSFDTRIQHTINTACKLNRSELLQKRQILINDFIQRLKEHYLYFQKDKDISRFKPDIEIFISLCTQESEFYSLRYFIANNIVLFVENKNLKIILESLIVKLKR